ncbi:amidohydrolase family protein [Hyphococcus formosus]|uniref:amidohydrolase family protein n=1 Tax=Hyphococcus formosus TaxID=3143534 RepID=UPI00398A5A15
MRSIQIRKEIHDMFMTGVKRRIAIAAIFAGVLLSGCGDIQSDSATSDAFPVIVEYEWFNGDTPAGEQTLTVNEDGSRHSTMRLQWNNRDFTLENRMQFSDDGYVVLQSLAGTSAFGAQIDETFRIEDGVAKWRNPAETGEVATDGKAFYVPARSGATETLAGIIRIATNNADGAVSLLPSGEARVRKLTEKPIQKGKTKAVVSLYAITGLEFAPTYVWLDENQNFFAFNFWGMTLQQTGWGDEVRNSLKEIQNEFEEKYYQSIASDKVEDVSRPILISNVNVVDVEAGELLLAQNVVSENGVITTISNDPIELSNAKKIDGTGKTLIPGLWDMHGHVEFFGYYGGIFNVAGGVTTVRDMGSDHDALMRAKSNFDDGVLVGPNVYAAGFIDQKSPFAETRAVETLNEALERIEWYADNGYIQIKLYSSISPDWVPALTKFAHEKGLRIGGHIPAFMTAEKAVRVGYDEISHINFLFLNFLAGDEDDTRTRLRFYLYGDEAGNVDLESENIESFIALLASNDVVVDPTVAVFDSMIGHHAGQPNPLFTEVINRFPIGEYRSALSPGFEITDENAEAWAQSQENSLAFVRKLHEGGVQLIAGTDALPGFAFHRELELYAQSGIPNADILKIATIDAARVIGQEDAVGSITVGKRADMVLLNSNPLDDISAVRDIEFIIMRNKIYEPDDLLSAVGVRSNSGAN